MIKHLDLSKQGHLSPTSGSVPWLVMSKVINHCDIDIVTNVQ